MVLRVGRLLPKAPTVLTSSVALAVGLGLLGSSVEAVAFVCGGLFMLALVVSLARFVNHVERRNVAKQRQAQERERQNELATAMGLEANRAAEIAETLAAERTRSVDINRAALAGAEQRIVSIPTSPPTSIAVTSTESDKGDRDDSHSVSAYEEATGEMWAGETDTAYGGKWSSRDWNN